MGCHHEVRIPRAGRSTSTAEPLAADPAPALTWGTGRTIARPELHQQMLHYSFLGQIFDKEVRLLPLFNVERYEVRMCACVHACVLVWVGGWGREDCHTRLTVSRGSTKPAKHQGGYDYHKMVAQATDVTDKTTYSARKPCYISTPKMLRCRCCCLYSMHNRNGKLVKSINFCNGSGTAQGSRLPSMVSTMGLSASITP